MATTKREPVMGAPITLQDGRVVRPLAVRDGLVLTVRFETALDGRYMERRQWIAVEEIEGGDDE